MRKIKAILLLASVAMTSPALAVTNLVTNGDFEAGVSGFTSNYTLVAEAVAAGTNNMTPENTYTVGTNAFWQHNSWAPVLAQQGTKYLIANGSSTDNNPVWKQTLSGLTVGATYDFSAYGVNICCNATFGGPNASPLLISVGSGGSPTTIATSGSLGATGTWTLFSGSFVATSGTTDLSIFTDINNASGNDFGLDAISVTARAVPEPATWAMMLMGLGLIGAAMRRSKQRPAVKVRYSVA